MKNMSEEARVSSIQRKMVAAGIVLGAAALLLGGVVFGSFPVNVTATVSSSISCGGPSTSTLAFGTLDTGAITYTTPVTVSTTIACNDGAGCYLSLSDAGGGGFPGLYATGTANYTIKSPNAALAVTSTIAAGTEYYGAVATTTSAGAGGTLTLNTRFNLSTSSNVIGGLTTTTLTLASTTSAITTAREVLTYLKAAIASSTPGGSYSDTLTYSCTGN